MSSLTNTGLKFVLSQVMEQISDPESVNSFSVLCLSSIFFMDKGRILLQSQHTHKSTAIISHYCACNMQQMQHLPNKAMKQMQIAKRELKLRPTSSL